MPSTSNTRRRQVFSHCPGIHLSYPYHNANSPPQKDDELEEPFLKGFEWDKEECWTRLIVHQSNTGPPKESGSKKSKKKNKEA
jgi:hypothetical protein